MNELLVSIIKDVAVCERSQISLQIMNVCRAITPQFYKNMSKEDILADRLSIELLVSNIDNIVLSKMCELAVKNYPRVRSENIHIFFDVNYLMTFYKQAFNYIWCDSLKIDRTWEFYGSKFNQYTNTLTETWKKNGEVKTLKYIVEADRIKATKKQNQIVNYHSPRYYELQFVAPNCDNWWE